MRLVDLSHPWNMHTPGWIGYPGSKIYYTQTLQTNRIVSQRVETSLHVGTHLDGPMHAADGAGDIASLPLTKLVREGVVVDVSDVVEDWSIIMPKHITDRIEVKRGDILILHTGYHRYYEGKPQQDLTRYFCMHPGGTRELAQWIHAENVGGDIENVLNTRCIIGAFPWKFEGGEACPCRIIAFLDVGPLAVEEVRHAVGKRSG